MSSKKSLNFELRLLQRINCQIITSKNCNVYCYHLQNQLTQLYSCLVCAKKRFIKHLAGAY